MKLLAIFLILISVVKVFGQSDTNKRLLRVVALSDGSYNVSGWVDAVGGTTVINFTSAGDRILCSPVLSTTASGTPLSCDSAEFWYDTNNVMTIACFHDNASGAYNTRTTSAMGYNIVRAIELLRQEYITRTDTTSTYYYISNSGSDSANGTTTSTPWQTISRLRTKTLLAGDTVLLKRGDTFAETLCFTNSNKGSPSAYITVGAYGGGDAPLLDGMTTVSGWDSLGNNLWRSQSSLTTQTSVNVLTIDGAVQPRGRIPKTGLANIASTNVSASYPNSPCIISPYLTGTNYTGSEMVYWDELYNIDKTYITNQIGTTGYYASAKISFDFPTPGTVGTQGFILQTSTNAASTNCATAFNDWVYDYGTKKIIMKHSGAPTEVVRISSLDNGVNLATNHWMNIKGLNIRGYNQYNVFYSRGSSNLVNYCNVDLAGYNAFFAGFVNLTKDNIADCNFISNSLSGAFIHYWDGVSQGSTANRITRNTIYNVGLNAGHLNTGSTTGWGYGIKADGSNTWIEGNYIYNCGGGCIKFYDSHTMIKNNFMDGFDRVISDIGCIYSWTSASTGTIVPHTNIVVTGNIGMNGIELFTGTRNHCNVYYPDSGANGITFSSNVAAFCDSGFYSNFPSNDIVTANMMFGCDQGISWSYGSNALTAMVTQVTYNIAVATNSGAFACVNSATNLNAAGQDLVTLNYNVWCKPLDDTTVNKKISSQKSLPNWVIAMNGQDANSTGSPIAAGSAAKIKFFWNSTYTNQAYALDASTYIDATNGTYTGSIITIPPWKGNAVWRP